MLSSAVGACGFASTDVRISLDSLLAVSGSKKEQ